MEKKKPVRYKLIIVIAIVICVAFFGGMLLGANLERGNALTVDTDTGKHLKLPGEVEKRVVTIEEVNSELKDIEEFSSYQGEYTIEKSVEQTRYFLENIKIPLTTNKIAIKCKGIVKVGYSFSDIVVSVDNESKNIYIALPKPHINDNYIIWDSVNFNEVNNILNPIEFTQYKTLFEEIEEEGKKDVINKGIYEKAEANIKKVIKKALSGFSGYTINFMEVGK